MGIHGEGQLTQWLREYAAGELTHDELAERVAGFDFQRTQWGQDSYWEKEIPSPAMEVDTWEELQWVAHYEPEGPARMTDDEWNELNRKVSVLREARRESDQGDGAPS